MPEPPPTPRLVYVEALDLELWRCRPLGTIHVLDLRDLRVGHFDGLIIDARADRPLYLVIRTDEGKQPERFLVPVGDAWFDDTERAIRIDAKSRSREASRFDLEQFNRMSPDEAAAFELELLGRCCPEVGVHRDGTPKYDQHSLFECPSWLRPGANQASTPHSPQNPNASR
jgi:hypothetical protein